MAVNRLINAIDAEYRSRNAQNIKDTDQHSFLLRLPEFLARDEDGMYRYIGEVPEFINLNLSALDQIRINERININNRTLERIHNMNAGRKRRTKRRKNRNSKRTKKGKTRNKSRRRY
jgi:hypothetical protein